ncbi:metallophosphoesterase, partial [Oligoflexia bacterium]|nr:metallophosphoesterase [Oligoflexia bacterium]
MKLLWLTDIHLEFLDSLGRAKFYQSVHKRKAESLLISGDIGVGENICELLKELSDNFEISIFFVLGNHD